MEFGLYILKWDKDTGNIVEYNFPDSFYLSEKAINKIYSAHSFMENPELEEEFVEVSHFQQNISSFYKNILDPTFQHELFIFSIPEREKINYFNLKSKIVSFAREVFPLSREDRIRYVDENIEDKILRKSQKHKVLALGRPGTGKTSIKKVVFEGRKPLDLINNPLQPTRGIEPAIYSWLDLNLGFFDTSGQELGNILHNSDQTSEIFANTAFILYIFDYPTWIEKQQVIFDDISQIKKIIQDKSLETELILFLHKTDLINPQQTGLKHTVEIIDQYVKIQISSIKHKIEEELKLPIYFTSIYPNLIYHTYNAFCDILSKCSDQSINLKNLLDGKIINFTKTMCFITNINHGIVAQSITPDFKFELINRIHNMAAQLNQAFLDMVINDRINYFLLSSYKGFTIIMKHLNLRDLKIMNLICVSETLTNEDIVELSSQSGIHIENLFTFY